MSSSLKWIRRNYNVPAFLGTPVMYHGAPATIAGGRAQYVRLRVEGRKNAVVTHPVDAITYPVLPLPKMPRGWCTHCPEERALRQDGTVVRHLRNGHTHFPVEQQLCPGAHLKPWAVCSWTIPATPKEAAA
jgi:hypothetical protein